LFIQGKESADWLAGTAELLAIHLAHQLKSLSAITTIYHYEGSILFYYRFSGGQERMK
jgi:hypothetical protein